MRNAKLAVLIAVATVALIGAANSHIERRLKLPPATRLPLDPGDATQATPNPAVEGLQEVGPLTIAKQGYFFVGGKYVDTAIWARDGRAGLCRVPDSPEPLAAIAGDNDRRRRLERG